VSWHDRSPCAAVAFWRNGDKNFWCRAAREPDRNDKIEKLNRQPWRSVEDVRAAVFEWIKPGTTAAAGTSARPRVAPDPADVYAAVAEARTRFDA
jgi:hypothetical protein